MAASSFSSSAKATSSVPSATSTDSGTSITSLRVAMGLSLATPSFYSGRRSSSTCQAGRRRRLADEVRRLPADRRLLFISGREALLTQRLDYRRSPALADRADPIPCTRSSDKEAGDGESGAGRTLKVEAPTGRREAYLA